MCVFVGKVAIRKDDLYKYSGKENWFHLQPVDPHSEVQVSGPTHLNVGMDAKQTHARIPDRVMYENMASLPLCG